MDDEPTYVLFNPRSGQGRGARLVEPVLQALRAAGAGELDHAQTTQAGQEDALTQEALARGFRRIVAVGGDGTWSNVGNAILRSGLPARLGLVPAGSGCDLAKSLGIPPRDLAACAGIVRAGHSRAIDVGRVEDRYFLNVTGFGFDIAVIEDTWRAPRLGGGLLYLYCALRQIYSFPGFAVEMEVEGAVWPRAQMLMLVIANGRIFGGGFRIAPRAELDDGRLDAVAFGNMGLGRRLALLLRLLRGTQEAAPEVRAARGASFRLRFDRPPAYETDGEWNRARSSEVRVESVPQALRVLVPAP